MKNNYVICDTSAIISLSASDDSNHQKAIHSSTIIQVKNLDFIIPPEVFGETLNIAGKKLGKAKQLDIAERLTINHVYTFTDSTPPMRTYAIELLKKLPVSVSYIDCLVMAFAHVLETKFIFGFDEAFEKNGYILPT